MWKQRNDDNRQAPTYSIEDLHREIGESISSNPSGPDRTRAQIGCGFVRANPRHDGVGHMIDRRIGVVRNFFHDRGFGLIRVLEEGKSARVDSSIPDVFLHVKELKLAGIDSSKIETGDTLEFDIKEYAKGFVASKVALVR